MENWGKKLRDLIEDAREERLQVVERPTQCPICWEPPPPSPEELVEVMKNNFPGLCKSSKKVVN